MKAKHVTFYNSLLESILDLDTKLVKLSIGDSVDNNRSLSISQLTRFLSSCEDSKTNDLGQSLFAVKKLLVPYIRNSRTGSRSDAVEVNEFLRFYESSVIANSDYRSVVSKVI